MTRVRLCVTRLNSAENATADWVLLVEQPCVLPFFSKKEA
jgi:hypothetical protein